MVTEVTSAEKIACTMKRENGIGNSLSAALDSVVRMAVIVSVVWAEVFRSGENKNGR